MKITITPSHKPEIGQSASAVHTEVSIEHPYDDLSLDEVLSLMKGALRAWGYSEKGLAERLGEE